MPLFLPATAQVSPGHPPTGPSKPVLLRRQAVPEETHYRLCTKRTEFAGGPVRRSSLAAALGLRVLPHGASWQLDLRAR